MAMRNLFVGELDALLGLHDKVGHQGVQTCRQRDRERVMMMMIRRKEGRKEREAPAH